MALSYHIVSRLAEETAKEITKSEDAWKHYLTTAARLYKYPFHEQMLIYAQRPDAQAVASIEIWNEKMNCWVNRGATGIALINTDQGFSKLKYVFDISDVHRARRIGKYPFIWKLNEEHKQPVLDQLEKTYGFTEKTKTFEERLLEIAGRIALEHYQEILPNIDEVKENSFLDGLDQQNLGIRLRDTLTLSIGYSLLSRCGADPDLLQEEIRFDYIREFNHLKTLSVLGDATTELCKPVLMEIGRTIGAYERQRKKEEKSLANTNILDYNALKRESNTQKHETFNTAEREEKEDEVRVYQERGLPDSEPDSQSGAGRTADEVRTDETELSAESPEWDLPGVTPVRRIEEPLPGNSEAGGAENGFSDQPDGGERQGERESENERSSDMDRQNEQYSAVSGGNRTEGDYLQLNLFASIAEQTGNLAIKQAGNFTITNDQLGYGTAKEKFRRNVEAIRTLKTIEAENRFATKEEQNLLSNYVGWGGLADAFDEKKTAWAGEYQELKKLLTAEEYVASRGSTLNAHYTSPAIIRCIYETLERMGLEKGNLLEPSMGIGNFFGMLPESMKESRLYGVELDSITGRIAKQLYPSAKITIGGFENTDYPNDFFDAAIGNVPFGQYQVPDRTYDKYHFLIHDYFFAKALDKVRPGGIVAFITSKGTMDKKNSQVRQYLAQRTELLGAVRLPVTAFQANAGAEVTSDILFLKKRDRLLDLTPEWIDLTENTDGITMNRYFAEHPEMIVGKMELVSGPYGMESQCLPDTSRSFETQLREACGHIEGQLEVAQRTDLEEETEEEILPADPEVKNYSYALVDGEIYYRENSVMRRAELPDSAKGRIKGLLAIRDCTRELIRLQIEEFPDEAIQNMQKQLNQRYDSFVEQFGCINTQANKKIFSQDSSYFLLCSLEKLDSEGKFKGKADMFTKRTIKRAEVVSHVDTATEALTVSLSEKAKIDLDYMSEVSGKTTETLIQDLAGVIFHNPVADRWETADEYLSGNVREKLEIAERFAQKDPKYQGNVQALTQIQPKKLDASEIEARIGATWIDPKYMDDFMKEVFETPIYQLRRKNIRVLYSEATGQWNVKGKNEDIGNPLITTTYGTNRRNAYTILEDSLNLKDSRVYDTIVEDGTEKRILNKQETMLAAQKQETIREAFKDWIFRDQERRQVLVEKYNQLFNATRPREYDGSHLKFPGMTPDIELKPHQKNAVAHVLYGNNTLLAHCVGAGKSATRS